MSQNGDQGSSLLLQPCLRTLGNSIVMLFEVKIHKVVDEWWIVKDFEASDCGLIEVSPDGTEENDENFIRDSPCPDFDSNGAPPECEYSARPLRQPVCMTCMSVPDFSCLTRMLCKSSPWNRNRKKMFAPLVYILQNKLPEEALLTFRGAVASVALET
jgi:hypothetical protein